MSEYCDAGKNITNSAVFGLKTLSIGCPATLLSTCSNGTETLREVYGSKKIKANMHGSCMIQMKTIFQKTKNQKLH